jgi:hypothetical protein
MSSLAMFKRVPIAAVGITLAIACVTDIQPTHAASVTTVVNFDNLMGDGDIPSLYDGINWENGWKYYDDIQPPYSPQTESIRVYNYEVIPSFSFNQSVIFNGAYFSGYDTQGVQFELLLSGSQVFLSTVLKPTETPTFLASGYSGLVDQVRILRSGFTDPTYWVMDDVNYTSIPTPALLPGLVGLGLGLWRRQKRAVA